jgi:hypothetical protein
MTAAAKDHPGSNLEFFLLISAGDMMQNQKARASQAFSDQNKIAPSDLTLHIIR